MFRLLQLLFYTVQKYLARKRVRNHGKKYFCQRARRKVGPKSQKNGGVRGGVFRLSRRRRRPSWYRWTACSFDHLVEPLSPRSSSKQIHKNKPSGARECKVGSESDLPIGSPPLHGPTRSLIGRCLTALGARRLSSRRKPVCGARLYFRFRSLLFIRIFTTL